MEKDIFHTINQSESVESIEETIQGVRLILKDGTVLDFDVDGPEGSHILLTATVNVKQRHRF